MCEHVYVNRLPLKPFNVDLLVDYPLRVCGLSCRSGSYADAESSSQQPEHGPSDRVQHNAGEPREGQELSWGYHHFGRSLCITDRKRSQCYTSHPFFVYYLHTNHV